MLLQIKMLLQSQPMTLPDLAASLRVDAATAKSMLNHFIRKAQVVVEDGASDCGSRCHHCLPIMRERYVFIEK